MKSIRLLILLILIISPGFAVAQSSAEQETLNVMESIFNVNPGYMESSGSFEYQHRYLGSLFGTFIFQIWNSGDPESITPLSYAIGFVNIISMLLAVITFLYVYILGAVGTASDASLLGKDNSATMIPVRTAIGFGLLMPVPGIGGGVFSTIQLLIVWVIVTGSNAATVMWKGVVKYIADNPEQVLATGSVDRTVTYDFAKMLTCSIIIQNQINDNNRWGANRINKLATYQYAHGEGSDGVNLNEQIEGGFFGFGSQSHLEISPSHDYIQDVAGDGGLQKMSFSGGTCGEIILPVVDFNADDWGEREAFYSATNTSRMAAGIMMRSVHSIIYNMTSEFDDYKVIREQYTSGDGGVGSSLTKYSSALKDAAVMYGDVIEAGLNGNFKSENSTETSDLVNRLSHGGWMNSILWFYERALYTSDRSTIINQMNTAFSFGGVPQVCNDIDRSDEEALEDCSDQQQDLHLSSQTVDTFMMEAEFTDDMARRKMANACPFGPECASTQSISTGEDIAAQNSRHISARLLSNGLIGSGHDVDSTSGRLNPFTVMSDLGLTMNRNAFIAWSAVGLGKSTAAALADSNASVVVNTLLKPLKWLGVYGSSFVKNTFTFIMLSIGPIILAILSNGFMLAYVVPFMPVLTWIAMLIGYLMMTIEAVIAAPLAVVLMFTPEGRGIVGTRLQSAINLINACTLRPMLMTLGVLAGVQLSYVAYEILNTFFWQVAQNYLEGGVFDFIAVLVVYVTSCYQVCKLIVSAIPRLPDQIMQWMSSGVGRAFGESEAMSNDSSAGHLSKGVTAGFSGGSGSGGVMKNYEGRTMTDIERNGSSKK